MTAIIMRYLLQYEMHNKPFCCILINQSQVAQCAEPDKSTRESEQFSNIYVFVLFLFYIYIASVTFKIVSRALLLMAGWAKKGGTDRNTRLVWNRHVEIH